MAGRDPSRTVETARRLPLAAPPPGDPDSVPLPESFAADFLFAERRSTLTLRRVSGRNDPPILVEESGCRIEGRAAGRAFAAVVDDPGEATLEGFGALVGKETGPFGAGGPADPVEEALAWTKPLVEGMERQEKSPPPPGTRIVESRWEARVDVASVRMTRRPGAPLPAPPVDGPETAGRSQDRSTLEVRVHLRAERDGRTVEVESARWADPRRAPGSEALGPLEDIWISALGTAGSLFESVSLPAMEGPVVFSPAAAGILLHEVCGHLLEGDLAGTGHSPFAGLAGQRIAPESVTLRDDPLRAGCRVRLHVDDEGEGTRPTVLIESGRLVGFLSHRRSAAALGLLSTGNARRESYRHPALPRMTNLLMEPGPDDPSSMLAGIGRGLLVERLGRGQVDPRLGRFRLEVETGRLVENGSLTRPVCGGYLVGRCLDLLESIDAVGSNPEVDRAAGACIKEDQIVPVGQVFPSLRVARLKILPGAGP